VIVRGTADGSTAGVVTIGAGAGTATLTLEAANPGSWSDRLKLRVDHNSVDAEHYNLWIKDDATGVVELIRNLPFGDTAKGIVARQSALALLTTAPTTMPEAPGGNENVQPGDDPFADDPPDLYHTFAPGDDGTQTENDLFPDDQDVGMYALARADLFNLLCIPPIDRVSGDPLSKQHREAAAAFCEEHRALFIVDGNPGWNGPAAVIAELPDYAGSRNAALYFPFLQALDPLNGNVLTDFPPCGAVAGVMARTDVARGVWKAPAGLDARIVGIQQLKFRLTDGENGRLNPHAVNCLRTFPASGSVVWGARTLVGDDRVASEWKYVPVRRTALFIEESLFRGTQWVVFEPNDEPLWAQIRLNVGAFMHNLFRQGAFQGTTPREAYLVKCDKETTTQTDINNGVVNILVGFAPLKPAEFVIVQIQQLAGQIET
jgi:Bacteriophage tail sheath protein